jgi:predicted DNA-binding protein YlxM (UPF0122 family)
MKGIREISEETGIPKSTIKDYLKKGEGVCPKIPNLENSDTNLTNYGIRSPNLDSLSTNSPNYENWNKI